MKRIVIDKDIEDLAKAYKKEIEALSVKEDLEALQRQYAGNEADYIGKIVSLWPEMITVKPDEYTKYHEDHFAQYDEDGQKEVNLSAIYKSIVDALHYDDVQAKIFPKYARLMGIRSCVYCNAQFAVSAKKGKTDRGKVFRSTYTLDHWKPKSKYPYMAVSFYNLYPCCSPCNQTKSYKDSYWDLYCKPGEDINPYLFKIEDDSLLNYEFDWDAEKLEIQFLDKNTGLIPMGYDDYFHIRKLYANFKGEVEEVIWRKRTYSEAMLEAMKESSLYRVRPEEIHRFIYGYYENEKDILKRPLAKLLQDVGRQMDNI